MTIPATIRKSDLKRYAEIVNETKVRIVIKLGEQTVTVSPDHTNNQSSLIDYSKPIL